jgi:hypothetical protein
LEENNTSEDLVGVSSEVEEGASLIHSAVWTNPLWRIDWIIDRRWACSLFDFLSFHRCSRGGLPCLCMKVVLLSRIIRRIDTPP